MYEATSETITEDYKASKVPLKEWKFQIENGKEVETIVSDQLLDTAGAATERAKSEFLRNSYKEREIRFSTYRTDFTKNQTINVQGLPYLIKSITTQINSKSIKTLIRAVRYE